MGKVGIDILDDGDFELGEVMGVGGMGDET
jgi:hypothetical protein